jgi:hypothetical protein
MFNKIRNRSTQSGIPTEAAVPPQMTPPCQSSPTGSPLPAVPPAEHSLPNTSGPAVPRLVLEQRDSGFAKPTGDLAAETMTPSSLKPPKEREIRYGSPAGSRRVFYGPVPDIPWHKLTPPKGSKVGKRTPDEIYDVVAAIRRCGRGSVLPGRKVLSKSEDTTIREHFERQPPVLKQRPVLRTDWYGDEMLFVERWWKALAVR